MFWGFVLEPKKRYNTTVTKPFHISMAALDPKSINDNDISSLVLNVDGTETILCNLGKPNYLQERLDLNFIEGNTITLEVKGKAVVHLSGYFIYEQDGMDDEDDSDLDEEESVDDEEEEADQKALVALRKKINKKSKFNASTTEDDSDDDDDEDESMDVSDLAFDDDEDDEDDDGEDDEDDDEDDEDDSEDEEVKVASPGSTPMPPAKKSKGNNAQANINNTTPISAKKKKQLEAQQAKQNNTSGKKNKGDKQAQSPQKQAPLTNGNTTPGSNKKKKNKENNASPNSNAGTPNNNKQAGDGKTPKKSLEGGVIVEDLKVGQGVPAKSGKMVSVYYAGKLKSNNKQFDATTQGPGFKFRLGKGEVIKGWDVGLNGMKVGGKRRITIPAHMAYGNKGSPPAIPPNSTLVFDVELKNVN